VGVEVLFKKELISETDGSIGASWIIKVSENLLPLTTPCFKNILFELQKIVTA